ncbi:MAG: adenosine deaminase [Oscillospiraceae bacterium]|nr:adenosine deaminase [Oscillospiraceae bacterium]
MSDIRYSFEDIKKIPKAELHLHLDGSLRPETIKELANEQGIAISKEELDSLHVSENCESLNEYLKAFELPLKVTQNAMALTRCTRELVEDLELENIIIAEIRFAPSLHTRNGLTQFEVVEAVLAGINQSSDIQVSLILCCMRGERENVTLEEANLETIEVAKKYLNRGVCGIDLAGAEALYPVQNHTNLFEKAKEYNIPCTIHAGEADGPESIWNAIELGADRIGHGVTAIEDDDLVQYLITNKIPLEMCPTSNHHTKAVNSISEHPIRKLLEKGATVTLNTDNRTVSNITLTGEVIKLQKELNLTNEQIDTLLNNTIESSFHFKKNK